MVYKLVHKPTGLIYKPGQYNLVTKGGKIYQTNGSILTYHSNEYINCKIRKGSKQHEMLKKVRGIIWQDHEYELIASIPRIQFAKQAVQ